MVFACSTVSPAVVRLGEGVSVTGRLSEAAMERTMDALRQCRNKLRDHQPSACG
jgi:Exopolyphosphatase